MAIAVRSASLSIVVAIMFVLAAVADETSRFIDVPPLDDGGTTSGRHALTICLPPGYDATDRRYPVVYILDGDSVFFSRANGVGDCLAYEMAHDQLVHDELIEPAILVAVHHGVDDAGKPVPRNREIDYCPVFATRQGKGEAFFTFLSTTVKGLIDRTYRTRPDAASTCVAGFSGGGLGAFWMTYVHPEVFGLGLCQSPGLRFAHELLDTNGGAAPPVRLWIDVGSREIANGLLASSTEFARALIAKGFRIDDDLAFQIGHDQGHDLYHASQRLRAALYFLLRLKAPAATAAKLVDIDVVGDAPIRLIRPARLAVERSYDGWFRLVDPTATITVADPAIAQHSDDLDTVVPIAAGATTVCAHCADGDLSAALEVPPPPPTLPCPAVASAVAVDGDLAEWGELPFVVDAPRPGQRVPTWSGPSDLSYRFACAHDDRLLYIAVRTTDDVLRSDPDKPPWVQDGIEVRIDARPAAARIDAASAAEFSDILLVAMSPAQPREQRAAVRAADLPEGTVAVCRATPTGHDSEIAVPCSWLDDKAGGPWSEVRINVVVNDLDDDPSDVHAAQFWWQGDWRTADDVFASGVFRRMPSAQADAPR